MFDHFVSNAVAVSRMINLDRKDDIFWYGYFNIFKFYPMKTR